MILAAMLAFLACCALLGRLIPASLDEAWRVLHGNPSPSLSGRIRRKVAR